jgi:hypothetical protein
MDEETSLRINEATTSLRSEDQQTNVREPTIACDGREDEALALAPGICLRGRYLLEAAIGRGAMGEVWKAKDLLIEEAHDRNPYVAIKVFLADIERHPQSFAAMHREASRAQKLAHPNIGTVYTLDRDDRTGRAFIAMELLDGEPLDKFIRIHREQPVDAKELWPIIKGMAEGLAYAHRRGIVHSDFKPGNVFVTREGVPKILDFGIARAVREEGGTGLSDDDDSVMSGYTEAYAAPEVLAGEGPHRADDVFAFGLVAYELLTGERAFGTRTSVEARDAGVKLHPIRTIRRREWRAIERSLAFERAERWPDAGKLLDALQRRVRLQIALAASLVALIATAGGLSYKNYLDALPAVPFEQLSAEQRAEVQMYLSDGREALELVRQRGVVEASADAADMFARAYAIHERNPDAVKGLKEAASDFIAYWRGNPERERAVEELRKFRAKSEYYKGYAPLERAINELSE